MKGIDHDGAGSVCLNGEIKSDSMTLNLTGVGSIEAERIICGNLSVHDNGTGSVTLKAVTADDASLFLNGVGSMDANFISSGFPDGSWMKFTQLKNFIYFFYFGSACIWKK